MLLNLWSIVHLLFYICFLYVIIQAIKLVYQHYRWPKTLVLVLGVLGFISLAVQNYAHGYSISMNTGEKIEKIELETIGLTDFHLMLIHGTDAEGRPIVIETAPRTTGLIMGFRWKTQTEIFNFTGQNKLEYDLTASLEWTFMGRAFYTEQRRYDGALSLSE